MSSELAKRLERAEKAIAKGKPDLALEEYLEALREDPKNDKVREAAADLYVTLNRPADAATLLTPLFDRLASIGDNARAVITFKKIARLATPSVEQWFRFGQLIEKSSRREALEAYETAVTGLEQSGRRLEAGPILQRIVALEPSEQNYRREGDLALDLGDNKAAAAAFCLASSTNQPNTRRGSRPTKMFWAAVMWFIRNSS